MLFEQDIAMRREQYKDLLQEAEQERLMGPGRVPARGYIGKPSTGLVPNW